MKQIYSNTIYAASLYQMLELDPNFVLIQDLDRMICSKCLRSIGTHVQYKGGDKHIQQYKQICPTSKVILDQQKHVIQIIDESLYQKLYKQSNNIDQITTYLIEKYASNNTSSEEIIIETIKMLFQR